MNGKIYGNYAFPLALRMRNHLFQIIMSSIERNVTKSFLLSIIAH